jgi:ABC-2 type transport system permease protein
MGALTAGGPAGPGPDGSVWADLAVVAGFAVAALALGAVTLRRRTP